jgi:hypothetical protein
VLHDTLVEVLSSQMSVTIGCDDLEDTVVDGQEGDIEGTTTQVEDQDVLLSTALLVKAVGDCCGCWLVDDTDHVESSDGASVLGCLSLAVVEVRWDSDHSVLDLLTEVGLGNLLHLDQDHSADLLRGELLRFAFELELNIRLSVLVYKLVRKKLLVLLDSIVLELTPNQTLDVKGCVGWVDRGLILSCLTNLPLSVIRKAYIAWRNAVTLLIRDDLYSTVLENTYTRVGRSKINSNDWAFDMLVSGTMCYK